MMARPVAVDRDPALRTPPHSIEAEKAVLGAIFADNSAYEKVSGFLRAERFAVLHHGHIFAAVVALIERGQHIVGLRPLEAEVGVVGQPPLRVAVEGRRGHTRLHALDDPLPEAERSLGVLLAVRLRQAQGSRRADDALVQRQAFGQLFFQRMQRVQAGHRFLKDKADVVAAHPAQARLGCPYHFFAAIGHRAADNSAVG